jgi:hypothetical protein
MFCVFESTAFKPRHFVAGRGGRILQPLDMMSAPMAFN